MNLECLNDIIIDNLAIHIDLTNDRSWIDFNTGLTAFSLTKWKNAVSDNINLIDFGLTGFDNGRTNIMWSGITLKPADTFFSMYRVGYNEVQNPTTGQTSGLTATTFYYPISAITTGDTENYYFELDGGYLQGFFNLNNYNYTLFPSRYNKGITIETILFLHPDSQGIFYMMGARAEDKYNPHFSGETITGKTSITGVITSEDNYLDAILSKEKLKSGFRNPQQKTETEYYEAPPIDNIKNNVIAFELTDDKKIAYKYINEKGLIVKNTSTTPINNTGFTIITITFTPDTIIDDPDLLECAEQRKGKLIFYVNGRAIWIIKEFPEFYFYSFENDKEKQLGVPYSISWGGGSFGLKHSWHYDYQTYVIYGGEDTTYINNNFIVEANPISDDCYIAPTGDTQLSGLTLSADSTTFTSTDVCDPTVEYPITVMRIEYTGTTATTYFVKFTQPISVLSNRDYVVKLSLYNDDFFKLIDEDGNAVYNKISIIPISDTIDVDVVSDIEYLYPLTNKNLYNAIASGLHPFPDRQEYQYIYSDGVMYYGSTGLPVIDMFGNIRNYRYSNDMDIPLIDYNFATGERSWEELNTVFRTKDNTGQNFVNIGLLIETSDTFNLENPLFIRDFTYTAADILVQDERKENQLIEQNFNSGFIGGIQKLRIYDNALNSSEILHNAIIEGRGNSNIVVSKGGRIIYR